MTAKKLIAVFQWAFDVDTYEAFERQGAPSDGMEHAFYRLVQRLVAEAELRLKDDPSDIVLASCVLEARELLARAPVRMDSREPVGV